MIIIQNAKRIFNAGSLTDEEGIEMILLIAMMGMTIVTIVGVKQDRFGFN
jgi:hypothetical protein